MIILFLDWVSTVYLAQCKTSLETHRMFTLNKQNDCETAIDSTQFRVTECLETASGPFSKCQHLPSLLVQKNGECFVDRTRLRSVIDLPSSD